MKNLDISICGDMDELFNNATGNSSSVDYTKIAEQGTQLLSQIQANNAERAKISDAIELEKVKFENKMENLKDRIKSLKNQMTFIDLATPEQIDKYNKSYYQNNCYNVPLEKNLDLPQ